MRLALVASTLQPGGAERALSLLANLWAAAGEQVVLILLDGPDDPVFFVLSPDVELIRLDSCHHSVGLVDALRAGLDRVARLTAVLRQWRPELVIAFLPEASLVAAVAATRLRLPMLLSERNAPEDCSVPLLWRFLKKASFIRADGIVFQTERARRAAPRWFAAKGVVIGNTIELPEKAAADHDAPHVVAAGRLTSQKGFDILIRAFAQLADHFPDWRLTIWGEGQCRGELEALRDDCNLTGRIALPGLSDTPMGWAAGASVFVLASRYEGFPNVLGEAMASGLAVIATDCRFGPADILHPGFDGLLVPADDPAALAGAMESLMSDSTRRRAMGTAARGSIRRFAADQTMLEWSRVVRQLTAGRRARSTRKGAAQ
jgi:glycosyltransferase involved in cell wall biosynthesis